jgi:hypothetical protein
VVLQIDDPWRQDYSLGPRGGAAPAAAARRPVLAG